MAVYGYNTAGGTAEAVTGNNKRFCKFTSPADMGPVLDISAYLDRSAGGSGYVVTAAIYTDNAGVPDALVANSVLELSADITRNSPAWYPATYSTAPSLEKSVVYWLGILATRNSFTYYNSGASNQQAENADTLPFDDPFGTVASYAAQNMSVFINYTPQAVTDYPITPDPGGIVAEGIISSLLMNTIKNPGVVVVDISGIEPSLINPTFITPTAGELAAAGVGLINDLGMRVPSAVRIL